MLIKITDFYVEHTNILSVSVDGYLPRAGAILRLKDGSSWMLPTFSAEGLTKHINNQLNSVNIEVSKVTHKGSHVSEEFLDILSKEKAMLRAGEYVMGFKHNK